MSFNKQDLRVGAPLAYSSRCSGSWDRVPSYIFGWTVERLTPTGKGMAVRTVTRHDGTPEVQRRAFQQQGYETEGNVPNGAVKSYSGNFHTNVEACQAEVASFNRRQEAAAALKLAGSDTARWTWTKDGMLAEVDRLEALLAKARAAVGAV